MVDWWQEQEVRRETVLGGFQIFCGTVQGFNPLSGRSFWKTSHDVGDGDNQPGIARLQMATFYPRQQHQEQARQENLQNLSAKYPQFEARYRSDHDQYEEDRETSPNRETRVNTNHLKKKYPQFEARYRSDHDQYEEDRDISPNLETRVNTNHLNKPVSLNQNQLEAVGLSKGHFEMGEQSEIKFEHVQTEVRQIKTVKESALPETLNCLELALKSDKDQQEDNFKGKETPASDYIKNEKHKLVEVRPQNPNHCMAKAGCHHCQQEVTDLENQVKAIWPRPRLILVMPAGSQDTSACQHSEQQIEEEEGGVEGEGHRDEEGVVEREKEVDVEGYKEMKDKQLAED